MSLKFRDNITPTSAEPNIPTNPILRDNRIGLLYDGKYTPKSTLTLTLVDPGKIEVVRNKERKIESVKINKVDGSKYWKDLFDGPKNDIISTIIRKESVLDSVKKQFLSNYNKKKTNYHGII